MTDYQEALEITRQLDLNPGFLSNMLGRQPSARSIYRWLLDGKDIKNSHAVLDLCRELKRISYELRPIELSFKTPDLWRYLLKRFRQRQQDDAFVWPVWMQDALVAQLKPVPALPATA